MSSLSSFLPYLQDPLVLAGFALFLVFGIHRALIKSGLIPPVSRRESGDILRRILRYGFALALVVILLGFVLRLFQTAQIDGRVKEDDLLAPNLSTKEALDYVFDAYGKELNTFDLIEAAASYYSIVTKPSHFFHRFPEWMFVFRGRSDDVLLRIKVADSRVPRIPSSSDNYLREMEDGWIAYYVICRYPRGGNPVFKFKLFNALGNIIIEYEGRSYEDSIDEVWGSERTIPAARYQVYGGQAEEVSTSIAIETTTDVGGIVVKKAEEQVTPFYSRLRPLGRDFIDVTAAVNDAVAHGATASPPDKEGKGGSGVVRLFDGPRSGQHIDLPDGPFWQIPYKVRMSPLLVHAYSGATYALNKDLLFTQNPNEWITERDLPKLQKKSNSEGSTRPEN